MGPAIEDAAREVATYSPAEAVAGILLTACGGDGTGGDALALLAARHPIFRDHPAAEFDRAVERMALALERDGGDMVLDACSARIPERVKPTVFALAVDLALAGGDAPGRLLIEDIRRALGIEGDQAALVVDILSVKNGGAG
ncbi:MAG: hypothetical protein ABIO39_15510 [Caulobacteraceae bacterium]